MKKKAEEEGEQVAQLEELRKKMLKASYIYSGSYYNNNNYIGSYITSYFIFLN